MHPVIELFGWEIRSATLMLGAAAATSSILGLYLVCSSGRVSLPKTLWILFAMSVFAWAGGRAHFIANRWHLGIFQADPLSMLRVWEGLHAPGAIFGLLVGTPLVLTVSRVPVGWFCDRFAPAVFLGIGLARVGCFLNGCCVGHTCHGPLCVSYPEGSPASRLVDAVSGGGASPPTVHPFALYLVAICAVAGMVAFIVARRPRYDGQAALLSAAVYLLGAAAVEPLRASLLPPSWGWAGMTQLQVLALGLALPVVLALFAFEVRGARRRPAHTPAR